jgi:hypothetical protein
VSSIGSYCALEWNDNNKKVKKAPHDMSDLILEKLSFLIALGRLDWLYKANHKNQHSAQDKKLYDFAMFYHLLITL